MHKKIIIPLGVIGAPSIDYLCRGALTHDSCSSSSCSTAGRCVGKTEEHTCNSLGMCCLRPQDSPVRGKKWMSKGTVARKDLAFLVFPTLNFGKYLSWEMPLPYIYIWGRNLPWGAGVGCCGAIIRSRRGRDWNTCDHPLFFYPLLEV